MLRASDESFTVTRDGIFMGRRPAEILRSGRARVGRFIRRRWPWLAAGLLVPVLLIVTLDVLLDEPIRRHLERKMNDRLHGYTVRLGRADFHLFGFSLDLEDLLVVQQANPDPPVGRIPRLTASVQWRELVTGHIVADFRFQDPVVYVNLAHFRQEQKDRMPVKERGWQAALESVYPFKINELKIVNGDVTYQDEGPFKPLHLTHINARAVNIRNIRSRARTYPSDIRLEAVVFDTGRVALDGHADFLAEPHLGVKADVSLEKIQLDYFRPITQRYNLVVERGVLSTTGTIEYAHDGATLAHLGELTLERARIDYVHKSETQESEARVARKARQKAREVSNAPATLIRVDRARIVEGTFGFVNEAATPDYRIFLADTDLEMTNLSNQFTEGTAVANLRGRFMGSGTTVATATFRPETNGADFDLNVRIHNTDMRTMNDLLRAYGKFDVVRGLFSLYTELSVKHRAIEGYVKPLFRDMKVYDKRQDREKSIFRKVYEGLVGGISKLLENRPREEVATKADISGSLDDPKASTWQVVVRLLQNAFFKAILPGFDRELGTRL